MEQIGDRLAMFQQDFVGGPIRDRIHPASPRVEKKERNAENQEQHALGNFEKRDQLEIANATRTLQNRRLVRRFVHSYLFAETTSFRNDRTFPAADLQLVTVGIFEKAGVIAAAVGTTDLWAFQILPADL